MIFSPLTVRSILPCKVMYSYGEALRLCRVNKLSSSSIEEKAIAGWEPDKQYPDGLHTFNRYKDVCVVDGLTFLIPS